MKHWALCFFIVGLFMAPFVGANTVYRWTDHEGVKHFSRSPPPADCATESCLEILGGFDKNIRAREHAEAANRREKLEKQRAEAERHELLRRIVSESQAKQDLKARVLLEGTEVCGSLTAMEQHFRGDYRLRNQLYRDGQCKKLSTDIPYSVIGKDITRKYRGSSQMSYVPVRLSGGDLSVDVWVFGFEVPYSVKW